MREMAYMGVPWNRVVPGEHTFYYSAGGKPFQATLRKPEMKALSSIPAPLAAPQNGAPATLPGDGTGHASLLFTLDNRMLQLGVEVHDRMRAEALIHDGDRCWA